MGDQNGRALVFDRLLKSKTHGFMVEYGAYDGEELSNSLFLEMFRSWSGLLIEPNPNNYSLMKSKNRKFMLLNAGLAMNHHSGVSQFSSKR